MELRVSTRGRIVIPVALRRQLGVEAGVRIHIEVDEQTGRIFLTPITRDYVRRLRGKYKGRGLLKALVQSKALDLHMDSGNP